MPTRGSRPAFSRALIVFTAQGAELAYLREKICAFVLSSGVVPINPFMAFGYFLYDLAPPDLVRDANRALIERCDELWVFGPISDGVEAEIQLARSLAMPTRYFQVNHYGTLIEEMTDPTPRETTG